MGGDVDETKPFYVEQGNAGNTVIDHPTHTSANAAGKVDTKRFDEVMEPGTLPYIHLMKMDAQGYEVKILEGASHLFSSGAVNAVKFELATDFLVSQNTSAAEYMNTFIRYGFEIRDTNTKQLLPQERLHSLACGKPIVEDFVAVRAREGDIAPETPTQTLITC